MQLSTQGIVLHTVPYGETSVVAKVFTRELGLRSYIAKGVRTATARNKQNLFQPMTRLDMVVYNNPRTQLNHIRELSPLPTAIMPVSRQHIAHALQFFMAEVLYRSLHEEEPLPALFDYTVGTIATLPNANMPHLPITFMLGTAARLGIAPMDNLSPAEPYFCLDEGRFISPSFSIGSSPRNVLDADLSTLLHLYLSCSSTPPTAPLADRNRLLSALIDYFKVHLATFGDFHSHEILHAVLE